MVLAPVVPFVEVDDERARPEAESADERVLRAALVCFARWGIAKSTAEDIAREAGISRATVYRAFPGGKAAIMQAVGTREVERIMQRVVEATARQDTLAGVLTQGIVVACEALRTHPALSFLLEHEPEAVLPFLAFDRLGPALALARNGCATTVTRFVPLDTAEELVEWATRMALSLVFMPGRVNAAHPETVANMVSKLLVPGFAAEMYPAPIPTNQIPTNQIPTKKDMP